MSFKRIVGFTLGGLVAALVIVYVADYAVLRYRIATHGNATGQVTIKPYFAIQMKNGDTDFEFQDPYLETCANSLFPHMGMRPCWYEKKHAEKRTNVLGSIWLHSSTQLSVSSIQ